MILLCLPPAVPQSIRDEAVVFSRRPWGILAGLVSVNPPIVFPVLGESLCYPAHTPFRP